MTLRRRPASLLSLRPGASNLPVGRSSATPPLSIAQRIRQVANIANGSTLLGLAVAVAARTRIVAGPRGLVLAAGYTWPLPVARAFTLGNVVLCRGPAGDVLAAPALLGHEERHCTQYAWCLGAPFLPLYLLAAGWSLLRTGNPGTANVFERHAGLAAGGYPVSTTAQSLPLGLSLMQARRGARSRSGRFSKAGA